MDRKATDCRKEHVRAYFETTGVMPVDNEEAVKTNVVAVAPAVKAAITAKFDLRTYVQVSDERLS